MRMNDEKTPRNDEKTNKQTVREQRHKISKTSNNRTVNNYFQELYRKTDDTHRA